jgi:hypothetical protein
VGPSALILTEGKGLTVTETEACADTHPFVSVTDREIVPEEVAVITEDVAPEGNQTFPELLLLLRMTLSPWQKVNEPETLITGIGGSATPFTVKGLEVPEHPLASVAVTE